MLEFGFFGLVGGCAFGRSRLESNRFWADMLWASRLGANEAEMVRLNTQDRKSGHRHIASSWETHWDLN